MYGELTGTGLGYGGFFTAPGTNGTGVFAEGGFIGLQAESAIGLAGKFSTDSSIAYPTVMLMEYSSEYARLAFANDSTTKTWQIAGMAHPTDSSAWMNLWYGDESAGKNILSVNGAGGANLLGNLNIYNASGSALLVSLGEGLDYAEGFNVSTEGKLPEGTVLVIDPDHPGELMQSASAYDGKVAGIIAGANGLKSGVRLGAGGFDYDVALAGRVYACVTGGETGIQPGDLLTTADTPGCAMKAADPARAAGAVLGKAMQPLEPGGRGLILVLVTLQ